MASSDRSCCTSNSKPCISLLHAQYRSNGFHTAITIYNDNSSLARCAFLACPINALENDSLLSLVQVLKMNSGPLPKLYCLPTACSCQWSMLFGYHAIQILSCVTFLIPSLFVIPVAGAPISLICRAHAFSFHGVSNSCCQIKNTCERMLPHLTT